MFDSHRCRIILITGMHRSGTSMVAHLISDAGVNFGSNLLEDSVEDNIEGYGEHAGVVEIHEKLLEDLDRVWHSAKGALPLPCSWQMRAEAIRARNSIYQIIMQETKFNNVWAVKDPRLCRFLPLWLEILSELGMEICIVVCYRNPMSVAKSLLVRNGMSFNLACEIWQRHYDDVFLALHNARNHANLNLSSVSTAEYDHFISSPQSAIANLFTNISIQILPDNYSRSVARVKDNLRHHHKDPAYSNLPEKVLIDLDILKTIPFIFGSVEGNTQGYFKIFIVIKLFKIKQRLRVWKRLLRECFRCR